MLSKTCGKIKVIVCLFFLITLSVSAKIETSDINKMEVVFNNIQENQNVLKNLMKKLILTSTDSDSNPDPEPEPEPKPGSESDSCVCVPYYQCDENTKEVIKDGHLIITPRFGEIQQCDDPTHFCCKIDTFKARISTAEPSQKCGYRFATPVANTIDNPNKGYLGEFPWTIVIRDMRNYQCVGSLIHPQVILTATHCTNESLEFYAVAGKLKLGEPSEPLQFLKVKEIVKHPMFERDNLHYDVAMLVLEKPFELNKYVNTICLPPPSPPQLYEPNYSNCVATGWGKLTSSAKVYERIMKKVSFSVMSQGECEKDLKKSRLGRYYTLDKSFVCASKLRGESLCDGDRGAPLACTISGYEDRYQQVGSLSWGLNCNEDPSVFAKTSHVRNWIDEQCRLRNFDTNYYTA